jgi:hypothetical protein
MGRSGRGSDPDDDRKKKAPARTPETTGAEQEIEAPAHEAPEPEHKRLQNQLGNQALAAMLGVGAQQAGADVEVEGITTSRGEEVEGTTYGGDDEPVDAGPPREVDLNASWRPRRAPPPKKADPIDRVDPLDEDDPGVDEGVVAWLREARATRVEVPPPSASIDAMVQPSGALALDGLAAWTAAGPRWMGARQVDRVLGWAVRTGASGLADPFGRPVVGSVRSGSAALWGVLRGALGHDPRAVDAAFVGFCLEVSGRRPSAHEITTHYRAPAGKVPSAVEAFATVCPSPSGRVRPTRLGDPEMAALAHTIADLCTFDDPMRQVPRLAGGPSPDPDDDDPDPLGLDASFGAPVEADAGLWVAARAGADRLASAATASAVQSAGAARAIALTCHLWSRGAPEQNLVEVLTATDNELKDVVRLLVEIARAVSAKSVALRGVETGLRRAAKMLQDARARVIVRLTEVAAAVLPPAPRLPAPAGAGTDGLGEALADGRPSDGQRWLDAQPTSLDRDAAAAVLAASRAAPDAPLRLEACVHQARAAGDPALEGLLLGLLAARRLAGHDLDRADAAAAALEGLARARRNGLALADAAIVRAEVARLRGRPDHARAVHVQAGAVLYHLGADGPMQLLARYAPPDGDS